MYRVKNRERIEESSSRVIMCRGMSQDLHLVELHTFIVHWCIECWMLIWLRLLVDIIYMVTER